MAGTDNDKRHNRDTGAKRHEYVKKGISIRKVNMLMAVITLVVAVFLLFSTISTNKGFSDLKEKTRDYENWQNDAYELRLASDYLTEQIRCYAQTGDMVYMENYFKEANEEKRRDKALKNLKDHVGDSKAYRALKAAMSESVSLMDREYYSMRLTSDAYGIKEKQLPKEIRQTRLKPGDAALSSSEKEKLGRDMVFDKVYSAKKDKIYSNMSKCTEDLREDMGKKQEEITDSFHTQLTREWVLIFITISVTVAVLLLTLMLVISPLVRAVLYIRAEQAIPVVGSKEFKFLAKTYNMMYEANKEQKEQLAYEVTHDQLTGIYNRSGYDFITKNTDWKTSALLLFDADKFKKINDTFGHDEGDHILEKIADTLKSSFRHNDYICRLGGDEFAVIMTHVTEAASGRIIEKVEEINYILSHPDDGTPAIRLSCGVAFGDDEKPFDELFKEADSTMYDIKLKGGGCRIAGGNEIEDNDAI